MRLSGCVRHWMEYDSPTRTPGRIGSRDGNRTRSLQLMRLARYRYSILQQTDSDAGGVANAGRPTATDHIPIR